MHTPKKKPTNVPKQNHTVVASPKPVLVFPPAKDPSGILSTPAGLIAANLMAKLGKHQYAADLFYNQDQKVCAIF